jgi:hypothetical protein
MGKGKYSMTYYFYNQHTQQAQDRFNSKFEKVKSGCWEWLPSKDADGYGQFTLNFEGKKYVLRAHRYSWVLANKKDWPTDKPVARHTCNNPGCVNPKHILPGTVKENASDAIKAGTHYNGTNARKRPVITPIGNFESGAAASRALGIRHPALIKLLKQKDSGYRYE